MSEFDFLDNQTTSRPVRRLPKRSASRRRQQSGVGTAMSVCAGILLAVALLFSGCVFLVGVGMNEAKRGRGVPKARQDTFMGDIYRELIDDAIRQYNAVVNGGGSHVDAYVRAGLVAEACLQGGEDKAYAEWIKVRDAHAKRAGISR